ncbi:hypothetical protein C1H46_010443 [Malus baccata]|uniref:Uncharacterized protein n=1 Tax=Malus baccata TaxID=106549 RepID=A0A540MYP1_MALBA|nr:hypothetical protein C1H46_010443 [Malus baccata]
MDRVEVEAVEGDDGREARDVVEANFGGFVLRDVVETNLSRDVVETNLGSVIIRQLLTNLAVS